MGSRLGQLGQSPEAASGDNIAGILSRSSSLLVNVVGLPFDAADVALNYQGLPSASGYQALFDGRATNLRVGHSAGAAEMSTLTKLGAVPSGGMAASLPFGLISPPGLRVVNGLGDVINGGWLGTLLNPTATVIETPGWPPKNHLWESYRKVWPQSQVPATPPGYP